MIGTSGLLQWRSGNGARFYIRKDSISALTITCDAELKVWSVYLHTKDGKLIELEDRITNRAEAQQTYDAWLLLLEV